MGNITVSKTSDKRSLQATGKPPSPSTDVSVKVDAFPLLLIFLLGTIFYWFLILALDKYLQTLNGHKDLSATQYLLVSLIAIITLWLVGRYRGLSFLDIEEKVFG